MRVLDAAYERSAVDDASWPDGDVPEFALAGRSNVGKSSALNALAGRKALARVSHTPGRTRAINFFKLLLAGDDDRRATVRIADLPGYGYAKASHQERRSWKRMVESYLGRRAALRAVVVLVDADVGPTELDQELLDWLRALGRPALVLATKVDKISRSRRAHRLREVAGELGLEPSALVGISARERTGLDDAWKRVAEMCGL